MNWVNDNRYKICLSIALLAGASIAFFLGKNPVDDITVSLQGFFANLTSEIIGALITILIIDWLLKRHQEHLLRDVHHLITDTLRLSVYETSSKAIGVIADPKYGIVISSECDDLLHNILDCQTKEALTHLEALTGNLYYPPLAPIAYTEAKNMARVQQREWTDFQIRFLPYLSPSQFASCAKIIDHLKDIYKGSNEIDRSFQRAPDGIEKILPASNMAPILVDEINDLLRECLELLKTTDDKESIYWPKQILLNLRAAFLRFFRRNQ